MAKSRKPEKTTKADSVEPSADDVTNAEAKEEEPPHTKADSAENADVKSDAQIPENDDAHPETIDTPDGDVTVQDDADIKTVDETKSDESHEAASDEPSKDEDSKSESPATEAVIQHPVPAPVAQTRPASIWPAVFGGVIAAMIGFIAGRGDQLDAYLPASLQRQSVDISAIQEQTDALQAKAEAIEATVAQNDGAQNARLEALENQAPDTTQSDTLADISAALETAVSRLEALENRPDPEMPDPVDTGVAPEEVTALQSALEAQRAEIEELKVRTDAAERAAASEAARILARAALTRVMTAVDTGDSFEPALGDLEQAVPVEVPDALRSAASNGVPTMAALREDFPNAARAALQAARAAVPESEVEGISGFLRRQLGARSVAPREGNDPDAILSRAEAAVKGGDLTAALSEMDALPEASKAAMQDWLSAAAARKSVQDAARDLSDSLQDN